MNAVIYRMAITQKRWDPRRLAIYDNARGTATRKKSRCGVLKRHLSNVIYRQMIE